MRFVKVTPESIETLDLRVNFQKGSDKEAKKYRAGSQE